MKDKILSMLMLQNQMNAVVHPDWHKQGYKWTRAIMVEGVEALDHYGWKWWKKQEPDIEQVRIELVDIWHFIMSDMLVNYPPSAMTLADYLEQVFQKGPPDYLLESDTRLCLEMLIARAAIGEIHMQAFLALTIQCSLSFDDLYKLYVGKNVLNMFRQKHGYKEGTYIKTWFGVEDNVALSSLMQQRPDATPELLEQRLEQLYTKVKNENS